MSSDSRASLADIDAAPESLPTQEGFDPALIGRFNKDFTDVSDENFRLKEEISALKSRLATKAVLDELIKPMASKSFIFMCAYAVFVGVVLLMDGFSGAASGCAAGAFFRLPAPVLNLLVGSTAATVVGLVGMVLTGVFVGARK